MMSHALIRGAARDDHDKPVDGVLSGAFARMFTSFVYPQIWEDPVVDMEALRLDESSRLITIASGGCNVMSYLTRRPRRVIAVDLNPAHLALLDLKLTAARHLDRHEDFFSLFGNARSPRNVELFERHLAPRLRPESHDFWTQRTISTRRRIDFLKNGLYRQGLLGRSITAAHLMLKLHGARLDRLANARDHEALKRAFDEEIRPVFDSWLVRLAFRLPTSYFGLGIPPRQFDALVASNPKQPHKVMLERTEKLLTGWPLDENYFAHQALQHGYGKSVPPYLQEEHFETIAAAVPTVEPRHQTITDALRHEEARALDGYVLLDAQDWMSARQITELWREITRTAAPGARFIFRTAGTQVPAFHEIPALILDQWQHLDALSTNLHARDRSGIYGAFHIYERRA